MYEIVKLNGCFHVRDHKSNQFVRITRKRVLEAVGNLVSLTAADRFKTTKELLRLWTITDKE